MRKKFGFTAAEVIITIGVVGGIAAMSVPMGLRLPTYNEAELYRISTGRDRALFTNEEIDNTKFRVMWQQGGSEAISKDTNTSWIYDYLCVEK